MDRGQNVINSDYFNDFVFLNMSKNHFDDFDYQKCIQRAYISIITLMLTCFDDFHDIAKHIIL